MEHEGSLPHIQVPATCPYPEHQKDTSIPIWQKISIVPQWSPVYLLKGMGQLHKPI